MLFLVGDKVVRIEHSRVKSKVLMWRLGKDVDDNGCGILNMRKHLKI
jgi:hypothetical protein